MHNAKVWIVSELYYPEDTSTGYFLTGIAEGLVARFAVSVLCGQPSYAFRGTRAPWKEVRDGVAIERCRALISDKNSLLGKLITHVTLICSMFVGAIRSFRRGDAVLVVTNPPLLPFAIAFACALKRSKCILIVHDVYPEVLVAAGLLRRRSLLVAIANAMNRCLLLTAGHVIVLGRDMGTLLRGKCPRLRPDRITVAPHWADVLDIRPTDRKDNGILSRLGLSGKMVVQYAGNIGRTHQIEALVECARRFQDDPRVHFIICGQGARAEWARREVIDSGLANVSILPRQPRERLCELLNACDISIISLAPGMSGVSVPSRLYNLMAAGKAVVALCDSDSEVGQVIREEKIGWVVPAGAPLGLLQVLREAVANQEQLANMGSRAREAAARKYTREITIARYAQVLDRVLGRPAA
ncbi:MAG: glycosyltransferase family 4 protein [Bryobacteraceae bacterium]|jgi:glycosyltransferase involved in cell wall biosynthesis